MPREGAQPGRMWRREIRLVKTSLNSIYLVYITKMPKRIWITCCLISVTWSQNNKIRHIRLVYFSHTTYGTWATPGHQRREFVLLVWIMHVWVSMAVCSSSVREPFTQFLFLSAIRRISSLSISFSLNFFNESLNICFPCQVANLK